MKHEATVVDTLSSLRDAAPAGVIGNELMLEHLHPNQAGYGVIADAFYDALHHDELDRDWPRYIDAETARLERPLTRIEILHGEYRVAHLLNDWPFVEQKREYKPPAPRDPEQQIAQAWFAGSLDWIGAMNAGLAHAQDRGDYQEAARIAMSMADAFPFEAQPQFVAGQMLIRRTPPQGKQAIPYFHRAATLEPDNLSYLATLAQAYVINGYDDAARDTARRLQQLAPAHPLLRQLRQYLDSKE
ncbi:MAG: hypothetical protein HKN49_13330 [Gammaproteobacteria bacterium]|nr:hypothetical protein [Gammaproteobacteria bacterium]